MSLGDASIEVQQGRPDVEALLRRAAAEAGPGSVVGVYAGGEPGQLRPEQRSMGADQFGHAVGALRAPSDGALRAPSDGCSSGHARCCALLCKVHLSSTRPPSVGPLYHPGAGPPPLMTAVHLAVARLNGSACTGGKEGAYLELYKEAVEL